jgi:hypothetical protein
LAFRNPVQLSYCGTKAGHDQATNAGGSSGDDKGVPETELIDRYAETDHHYADRGDHGSKRQQDKGHAILTPAATRLTNCDGTSDATQDVYGFWRARI